MTGTTDPAVRTDDEVDRLRAERGGYWPVIRRIHRHRPILTALLVLAAPVHALLSDRAPVDLLQPRASVLFVAPWVLMVLGVGIRIWGAGNLRKNQEITSTGVYQMVRHPLYTGSLAFFLAYFLTVTDPLLGLVLFLALVGLVYYPTMLGEEEYLALKFPGRTSVLEGVPRLVPDPRRLPRALRQDRFSTRSAFNNLALRSIGFLIALPIFLKLLIWLQESL